MNEKMSLIKEELLELGLNPASKGVFYWLEAIQYVINIDRKWIMQDVYKYVANNNNSEMPSIERALRTSLKPAHKNIQQKYKCNKKVTNKMFLDLMIFKYNSINIKTRNFEFVKRIKGVDFDTFKLPERSTKKSAGYDFFAPERIEIPPYKLGDNPTMVKTGVKVYMPENEFLMLVNRSSNPKKKKLVIPNSVGIIDADYYNNPDNEGEMMFGFYNVSNETVVIEAGEKLGQGIFVKFGITDNDNASGLRVGGIGSTGK